MAGIRSVDAEDAEKVGTKRGSLRFHLPDGEDSLQHPREGYTEVIERFQPG